MIGPLRRRLATALWVTADVGTYDEMQAACEQGGGHLVVPASEDELFLLAAAAETATLLEMSLRTLLDRDMETGMRLLEREITISAVLCKL